MNCELIPIFDDNYVFVIIDDDHQCAVVIDPGEASAVTKFLLEKKLKLSAILLTHHHHDHIGGVEELKNKFACEVYAPLKNKNQISNANYYVAEAQRITINQLTFEVKELPGHTLGHVAYWLEKQAWLFSGDVIFGLGCGRLFEGVPAQMFESLSWIKTLPAETKIFCTHEYTQTNLEFTKSILTKAEFADLVSLADLKKYEDSLKIPSVPLLLSTQRNLSLFLQTKNLEQFTKLRQLRNQF
ncbi:MAG: hydroxyacylglutathione hydrolase [Bdellovibrio sp.]|nr:hydroxyacylglutathione hydrolase [Bdellovibrio sp.]